MRAGTLLHTEVVDSAGLVVGRVRDVRLVRDGPILRPSGERAPRVDGLIVGRVGFASGLGYGRTVSRPWPLAAIIRWLLRHERYVRWDDIDQLTSERITLRVPADRLRPPG